MEQIEQHVAGATAAETYQDFFVPAMFEPWARTLLDKVGVRPGDAVLDVACGTGAASREAARRIGPGGSVTGVDLSPGMLAVASRMQLAEVPMSWIASDATHLPFANGSFDVVICQQGVQFFPDRAAAVREMHRVLRPGGRVGIMVNRSLAEHEVYAALYDAASARLGTRPEALGTPFVFGDAGALRALLADAGFLRISVDQIATTVTFPGASRFVELTMGSTAVVVHEFSAMDPAQRATLGAELSQAIAPTLAQHTVADGVRFDVHTNVGVGVRGQE